MKFYENENLIVLSMLYISYNNTILKNIPFLAFEKKMFRIAKIILFLAVFFMPSTRIIFYGIPMG